MEQRPGVWEPFLLIEFYCSSFLLRYRNDIILLLLYFLRGRVDDFSFDCSSPISFLLIEFHCTFPYLIKCYHINFIIIVFWLGSDRPSGLTFLFSSAYFFPNSRLSSQLHISSYFLFRSFYSNARVSGKTLVHEFLLSYSHTEWYHRVDSCYTVLISSKNYALNIFLWNFTEVTMKAKSFLKIWLLSVNFEEFASMNLYGNQSQSGVWRTVIGCSIST